MGHALKKEIALREKAEAAVRKMTGAPNAERQPSAQSRAEFKQRVAFQEETMQEAAENESQQLRSRLKWIFHEATQSLVPIEERAWQLPVRELDQVVVPAVTAALAQVREMREPAAPTKAPPASVSGCVWTMEETSRCAQAAAAPLTVLADDRRKMRELEQRNTALQLRVDELNARISHRDQMLDYTLAVPPAQEVAAVPEAPPTDDREKELYDFFANVLSPRK